MTTELTALECLKMNVSTFSFAINLFLLKLAGKEEMHNFLNVLEFGQVGRQTTKLDTLEHPKILPFD